MFYTFRQNNTGGSFVIESDRGLSVHVIVEAGDNKEANDRAQRIGLYFEGCEDGRDCSCCGDRWYAQSSYVDHGEPEPTYIGEPIEEWRGSGSLGGFNWAGELPDTFVHYLDGTVVGYRLVDNGTRYERVES